MGEPKISYGTGNGEALPPAAQYLLAKAGIGNGFYTSGEFIGLLNEVAINELLVSFDNLGEIFEQRHELVKAAAMQRGSIVTIENFKPDLNSLEELMKQPFE